MKRMGLLAVLLLSTQAYAYSLGMDYKAMGPYDVIAPALNGDPAGADRQVGQIFLDVTSGGTGTLKVVGSDGSILNLSAGSGNPVTSGGTEERIERAYITNTGSSASVTSQSGSWLNPTASRPSAGLVTLTILNGVFDTTPSCTCTSYGAVNNTTYCGFNVGASNTTITAIVRNENGVGTDYDFSIICMGEKDN